MKCLSILLGLFITLSVSAQDVSTFLRKGGSFTGLNKQGDTLTASLTVNYVIELGDEVFGVLKIAIETDSVSGTAAYDAFLQKSLNNENWDDLDTISHSVGGDYYEEFNAVNATDTFYRVIIVATSATQKSLLKIWGRLNEGFVIEN